MTIEEIQKAVQDLGAQLMTLREDLKAAQAKPSNSDSEIKLIREEISKIKAEYDAFYKKLSPPVPAGGPPADDSPSKGFFDRRLYE